MAVTMICPNLSCQQTVIAPDTARGKLVRCAHCKQVFLVPAAPVVEEEDEKQPPQRKRR